MFPGGPDHLFNITNVDGHGFFRQYVFSRFCCIDGDVGVLMMGCGQLQDIDIGTFQELAIIGHRSAAVLPAELLGPLQFYITAGNKFNLFQRRQDFPMYCANPAAPD